MKKLLLLACSVLAAVSVYAQGTVNFANGAAGVNAPVNYGGTAAGPANPGGGNIWYAMLYAGPVGTAESSLSSTIVSGSPAILGATSPGYVFGGARDISGITSGSQAVLQIRAWSGTLYGSTAPTGVDRTSPGVGWSNPITITLGGGTTATPNMTGLTAFAINPIPEPSSIALGLLGLGAVALFRRRK